MAGDCVVFCAKEKKSIYHLGFVGEGNLLELDN